MGTITSWTTIRGKKYIKGLILFNIFYFEKFNSRLLIVLLGTSIIIKIFDTAFTSSYDLTERVCNRPYILDSFLDTKPTGIEGGNDVLSTDVSTISPDFMSYVVGIFLIMRWLPS
jgi:hypothetical protein